MLYYGNARNIQTDCIIFNFTSYIEGYQRLNLIPPNSLGASSEYEFDRLYMDYILSDDFRFMEFFNIINLLSSGQDIYLIVSDDNWSENLVESLLKLIQQRYGYNATRINNFEDIITAEDSDINKYYGVQNFDIDEERYTYLLETARLRNGGKVGGDESLGG